MARREKDTAYRYDEVWCVFDVDQHPNLKEAREQARANDVQIALSNPCFELWILLHFQDQHAYIENKSAASACRRHIPRYEKHITYAELKDRYVNAVSRAKDLDAWQVSRDNEYGNPSTKVYILTERLQELGKQALLRGLGR